MKCEGISRCERSNQLPLLIRYNAATRSLGKLPNVDNHEMDALLE
jgi:hypothetical protein